MINKIDSLKHDELGILKKMTSEELMSLYKENKKEIRENIKEIEKLEAQLNSELQGEKYAERREKN